MRQVLITIESNNLENLEITFVYMLSRTRITIINTNLQTY